MLSFCCLVILFELNSVSDRLVIQPFVILPDTSEDLEVTAKLVKFRFYFLVTNFMSG